MSTPHDSLTHPCDFAVLDLLRSPVWMFDPEFGQLRWANRAALKLLQIPDLEQLDRDSDPSVEKAVSKRSRAKLKRLNVGQTIIQSWRVVREGHVLSIRCACTAVRLESSETVILVEAIAQPNPEMLRSMHALRHATTMVSLYTLKGEPIMQNPAALQCYGDDSDTVSGDPLERRLVDAEIRQRVRANLAAGKPFKGEVRVRTLKGLRWHELEARQIEDPAMGVSTLLIHESDITDRKRRQSQLAGQNRILEKAAKKLLYDALHDVLTGLPNRSWFTNRLERVVRLSAERQGYLYAVLFLDLDRFKAINDSLGHLMGDRLIARVAQRLRATLKEGQEVARLGGDEFAILLEDIQDTREAIELARQIQQCLELPFHLDRYELFTGASIGITLSTIGYDNPEDVLRDADSALHHAKVEGKGHYLVFDPVMQTDACVRWQLENDLRRAIETYDFRLHYQPIVCLQTDRLVGFEALMRWHHPQNGWVSPATFIPVAEETGQINSLGWWVLRQACYQLSQWQQQFPEHPIVMNVNLSARQLKQVGLIDKVAEILQETNLPGSALKLEITESFLLETVHSEAQLLWRLKDLGIRLCIDDFGTGYSSLSRLHEFPVDTLKIDRAFVSRMGSGSSHVEIVQTIVTLAHALEMDVVAEGVETPLQRKKLKDLGCEFGQGYLFAKPVDRETASDYIQGHSSWLASDANRPVS